MKKVFYLCGCGCEYEKEQMAVIRATESGNSTSQLRCPEHREKDIARIISRKTTCDKCGKVFKFSRLGGTIPTLCNKHKREHRLKKMRAYAESRKDAGTKLVSITAGRRNSHLRDTSRWDCESRDTCLMKYQQHDAIPCKPCQEYKSEPLQIDAMAGIYRNGETFVKPARAER